MRTWLLLISLLIGLCTPSAVGAASIQFLISTGEVTAARDEPITDTVPGHGVVTLAEPAASIQWPIPTGCTTGGIWQWTRISDAGAVTVSGAGMEVRPELVGLFFATTSPALPGCHLVHSWAELKRLMETTIVSTMAELELVNALAGLNAWKDARCLPADAGNQNCIDWTTQLTIVNDRYPGRGQGITTTTELATLITEVFAFRTAKGW